MNYISTFFSGLSHLFYPHTCPGCGSDLLTTDQVICMDCILKLPFTGFHHHPQNPVEKVFRGRLSLEGATSFLFFTKQSMMQNLMHQFKYRGRKEVGSYLGRQMGAAFKHAPPYMFADALVPLPLHHTRLKKRGYNQAKVLCDAMSEIMNVPVIGDAVKRTAKTTTQTHKNRSERWTNIAGKFEVVKEELLRDKHLLLVDDVLTTGATLESCGANLTAISGVRLSITTLAFTLS